MGLFNKLFKKKDDKIEVWFIDETTGKEIGKAEMEPKDLPETFSRSTTMRLEGQEWEVKEAIPANAADFIQSGQLVLKLARIGMVNLDELLYTLPSIADRLPQLVDVPPFAGPLLSITEDDWRQAEFLDKSVFPLIDMEIERIQDIWDNHCVPGAEITGFKQCVTRDIVGDQEMELNYSILCNLLDIRNPGSIRLGDQAGFVAQGFSFETATNVYYGILNGDQVVRLCIVQVSAEGTEEIQRITKAFDLIFVAWYRGQLIVEDQ